MCSWSTCVLITICSFASLLVLQTLLSCMKKVLFFLVSISFSMVPTLSLHRRDSWVCYVILQLAAVSHHIAPCSWRFMAFPWCDSVHDKLPMLDIWKRKRKDPAPFKQFTWCCCQKGFVCLTIQYPAKCSCVHAMGATRQTQLMWLIWWRGRCVNTRTTEHRHIVGNQNMQSQLSRHLQWGQQWLSGVTKCFMYLIIKELQETV